SMICNSAIRRNSRKRVMNVSEEYKITAGTISGATFVSVDIEPSIIVDGKSYTASEFNKAVEMLKQPQLNESQQIVLDYLKDKCNLYSFIAYKPFEAIIRLSMLDPEKNVLRVKNTIDELTYVQQSQVLVAFSRWALEQEEE
ncbi:hypothetical protein, partial [Enterococcus casseliflavus]